LFLGCYAIGTLAINRNTRRAAALFGRAHSKSYIPVFSQRFAGSNREPTMSAPPDTTPSPSRRRLFKSLVIIPLTALESPGCARKDAVNTEQAGDIWYMQGPYLEAAQQFGYQGRLPVRGDAAQRFPQKHRSKTSGSRMNRSGVEGAHPVELIRRSQFKHRNS
jgi:hypothetical protein